MSFMTKPRVAKAKLPQNARGLTLRDYEGAMSTLCAGCGHDSVTAALVRACYESNIAPHRVAKLSGIGCSSKTPAYFLGQAHGFNAVHGRMPSVATGAQAANRDLLYIGISGDGDSLSIGFGQFAHAMRRNLNITYLIENNGVYALTKGQFSASADIGSQAKKGEVNELPPIDPVSTAISLGATFVARGFSGDKEQLVPLLKAAMAHRGFALVDVLSPCVTFNDHKSSTKSYAHTREFYHQVVHTDFVPPAEPVTASSEPGEATTVELHDGSHVVLRRIDREYDPTDRIAALRYLAEHSAAGEVVTGLLYIRPGERDFHAMNQTASTPLNALDYEVLCPGKAALDSMLAGYR